MVLQLFPVVSGPAVLPHAAGSFGDYRYDVSTGTCSSRCCYAEHAITGVENRRSGQARAPSTPTAMELVAAAECAVWKACLADEAPAPWRAPGPD